MAKLPILAVALLLALFSVAGATTYTTTVTTTTVANDQGSREECQQQIQGQQLHQCASYLFQGSRQPYPTALRMTVADEKRGGQKQQQEQQLQECCQQLRNVESRCRCAAVGEVVRQQMQEEQLQGQQLQQVLQKAQNLPRDCNMQQPQQCQIQPLWF